MGSDPRRTMQAALTNRKIPRESGEMTEEKNADDVMRDAHITADSDISRWHHAASLLRNASLPMRHLR